MCAAARFSCHVQPSGNGRKLVSYSSRCLMGWIIASGFGVVRFSFPNRMVCERNGFLSLSASPVRCLGRNGADLCLINSLHLAAGGEKRGEVMV